MKKRMKYILAGGIIFLLVSFLLTSYITGSQVFKGSTQLSTNEETKGVTENFWKEYDMDYDAFCKKYRIETIGITSSLDGHNIPADYIYADKLSEDKNHKTVILVHGLGGNRYTTYPIGEFFLEQGYNVLAYDQRSSNENTAEYTTFGYWEKFDLIDCIDYVKMQAPDINPGIWGTSFGGATVAQAVGYEDTKEKVDFMILDCPVSSMEWMLKDTIRQMNMPIPTDYMLLCGNIFNKTKLGFVYKDADAAKAVKEVDIPVLVVNTKSDEVTPYFMGKDIYDALPEGNKSIWTLEQCEHARIWKDYRENYQTHILQLLEKVE